MSTSPVPSSAAPPASLPTAMAQALKAAKPLKPPQPVPQPTPQPVPQPTPPVVQMSLPPTPPTFIGQVGVGQGSIGITPIFPGQSLVGFEAPQPGDPIMVCLMPDGAFRVFKDRRPKGKGAAPLANAPAAPVHAAEFQLPAGKVTTNLSQAERDLFVAQYVKDLAKMSEATTKKEEAETLASNAQAGFAFLGSIALVLGMFLGVRAQMRADT